MEISLLIFYEKRQPLKADDSTVLVIDTPGELG